MNNMNNMSTFIQLSSRTNFSTVDLHVTLTPTDSHSVGASPPRLIPNLPSGMRHYAILFPNSS